MGAVAGAQRSGALDCILAKEFEDAGPEGKLTDRAAAIDRSGKVVARVRFTDVYAYRDGRWQCVAGHESLITPDDHEKEGH